MSWVKGARTRLRLLFAERSSDARMEDEMRFHVEMETQRIMRAEGLDEAAAHRQAAIAFGGLEKYKEQLRDGRGNRWFNGMSLDVKHGFRMLMKFPVMTAAGVLAIAVAIALATSWFEFMTKIMRPDLGMEDQDRIVRVQNFDIAANAPDQRVIHEYEAWRQSLRSVEDLTAITPSNFTLVTDDRQTVSVRGAATTPSMFALTRTQPMLGRALTDADMAPGAPAVVVLGHGLWERVFGADPAILGKTVRLGATVASVIGVMPPGFGFPSNQEAWVPFRERASSYEQRRGPVIYVSGRLADGYTLEEAQAELALLGERASAEKPATHAQIRAQVYPYTYNKEMYLATLAFNVPFMLFMLVVCANVATLVFARTATREGELAVRSALGASRGRLMVQLFAEALVMTVIAAAVGLAITSVGMRRGMDLFFEVQQSTPPFWFRHGLSGLTMLYAFLLAVVGAALIGGIPAWKATGRRLRHRLAQPGSGGAGMRFGAVSTAVIIVQVAICVAFLPYAVLQGLDIMPQVNAVETFPAGAFLTAEMTASGAELEEGAVEPFGEIQRRLAATPGVLGVSLISIMPGMNHGQEEFRIEGDTTLYDEVRTLLVDDAYFDLIGANIVDGRDFQSNDFMHGTRSVLVDAWWVEEEFGGVNPIGKRIQFPGNFEDSEAWYEIVGVIDGVDPAIGPGSKVAMFMPWKPLSRGSVQMYMRTAGAPDEMGPVVQDVVAGVDPSITVFDMKPLDMAWRPVQRSGVFFATAFGVIGVILLGFALIGIYALMSFTVTQRAREIGIRTALGANPRRILASIFSRAIIQVSLGIVLGATLISLAIRQDPNGPRTVAGVAVLMMLFGLIGCVLPAMRALRIQPTDALRAE